MDSHLVINICCMLGGMLAALCWLKRGRNEYIRYAMILLPYGALLYMMTEMHLWSATGHFLQRHLIFSAPVLLFLLGRYMLKCDWKRALLSSGIYAVGLVVMHILCAPFKDEPSLFWKELLMDSALDILFTWLLVWLCARPYGISAWTGFLTAACVKACRDCLSANFRPVCTSLLSGLYIDMALELILAAGLLVIFCTAIFSCIMRYVHNVSWTRSLCFGAIPSLFILLAMIVIMY